MNAIAFTRGSALSPDSALALSGRASRRMTTTVHASILRDAIQSDHRVLTARDGFTPIDRTEVALVASPDASPATLRLAEFCNNVQARAAWS